MKKILDHICIVESGIEKMFAMMSEMTWLRIEGDAVVVESETYIRDQPVAYEQVKGVIDEIRRRGANLNTT